MEVWGTSPLKRKGKPWEEMPAKDANKEQLQK
jgi:hypothetical protein